MPQCVVFDYVGVDREKQFVSKVIPSAAVVYSIRPLEKALGPAF